jgi:hypothetical protein
MKRSCGYLSIAILVYEELYTEVVGEVEREERAVKHLFKSGTEIPEGSAGNKQALLGDLLKISALLFCRIYHAVRAVQDTQYFYYKSIVAPAYRRTSIFIITHLVEIRVF